MTRCWNILYWGNSTASFPLLADRFSISLKVRFGFWAINFWIESGFQSEKMGSWLSFNRFIFRPCYFSSSSKAQYCLLGSLLIFAIYIQNFAIFGVLSSRKLSHSKTWVIEAVSFRFKFQDTDPRWDGIRRLYSKIVEIWLLLDYW